MDLGFAKNNDNLGEIEFYDRVEEILYYHPLMFDNEYMVYTKNDNKYLFVGANDTPNLQCYLIKDKRYYQRAVVSVSIKSIKTLENNCFKY